MLENSCNLSAATLRASVDYFLSQVTYAGSNPCYEAVKVSHADGADAPDRSVNQTY